MRTIHLSIVSILPKMDEGLKVYGTPGGEQTYRVSILPKMDEGLKKKQHSVGICYQSFNPT